MKLSGKARLVCTKLLVLARQNDGHVLSVTTTELAVVRDYDKF